MIVGTGTEKTLSVEDWNKLLQVIETNCFPELPEIAGRSYGPCEPVTKIAIRTRTSHNVVQIMARDVEQPGPANDWTRALSVWNALRELR
ncbi:MAG: hypothetical protein ACI8TQ_003607 [Planctomycetota bacterium]|jgi:hypothetical protein